MKTLNKNKKGFTLIEIIVVLVIMGILLAIAVPSILGYVSKAKDAQYLAEGRGGYLGAQAISARAEALNKPLTTDDLTFTAINNEMGYQTSDATKDGYVTVAKCLVTANTTDVVGCNIRTTSMGTDKYVRYTANEEAEVITATTVPDFTVATPAD